MKPSQTLQPLDSDNAPSHALTLVSQHVEAIRTAAARRLEASLARWSDSESVPDTYAEPADLARRLVGARQFQRGSQPDQTQCAS